MIRWCLIFFFDASSSTAPWEIPKGGLRRSPRPLSLRGLGGTKTPLEDNSVPECNIKVIALFLITIAALRSALSR